MIGIVHIFIGLGGLKLIFFSRPVSYNVFSVGTIIIKKACMYL